MKIKILFAAAMLSTGDIWAQDVQQLIDIKSNGVNSTEILMRKQDNSYHSIYSNTGGFGFYNSTNNKSSIFINGSNNVGVGTADPQTRLDVNGIIQTYNKDSETANWDNLRIWSDGINSHIQSNGDEAGMIIQSTGANKVSILSNLNINTTENLPGYSLSVNGKIRAKELKIEVANWPDYVFAEDYQLPELQQTDDFIKKNGHLPGIPSAKAIEKGGIEVGEMNRLLLEKIEELTLHLIRQEKEIKVLKQRLATE